MFVRVLKHHRQSNHLNRRFIYSTAYKNSLQPSVARINRSFFRGNVQLEVAKRNEFAFENHLHDMQEQNIGINTYKYIFLTIMKNIIQTLQLFRRWVPQLSISKDGNIESKAKDNYTPLTHGIIIDNTESSNNTKHLYAIPQHIWEAFIAELPDQDIVKRLNLSEHRHLWLAYNFVVSASNVETRNYRIDACSRYHFFADKCYAENGEAYTKLVDSGAIANGEWRSQAAILPPYMTPLYLEKFSHCARLVDFQRIGERIILKSSNADNTVNVDKRNEFIAALPSSKKDPERFLGMLVASANIGRFCFMHDKARANLLYNGRNNFSLFNKISVNNGDKFIADYCRAIVNNLLFPEAMRRLMMSSQIELIGVHKDEIIKLLKNDLLKLFSIHLTEHINIAKLNHLQERWHRNITVIRSNMPASNFSTAQWHSIFPEQNINDVTFTCLTTRKQLQDEGGELDHCVGGYDDRCMDGTTHIIKVKALSGERSTIELQVRNNRVSIVQNFGYNNQMPNDKLTKAANLLLEKISNNEILLNQDRGEIILPGMTKSAVHQVYPYSLTDDDAQEAIYQAYKNAGVLPSFMTANDYKSMVAKNENVIQGIIDELCAKNTRYDVSMMYTRF